MARNDISYWRGPEERLSGPIAASETYREGEVIVLGAAGTVGEATDDPSFVSGIAVTPAIDIDSASLAVGTQVVYIGTDPSTIFRTQRFATDGSGTAATPTQTNAIGELAGLTFGSGNWTLDTGAGNAVVRIFDVLDISGRSLADPNLLPGAGVTVLFKFI